MCKTVIFNKIKAYKPFFYKCDHPIIQNSQNIIWYLFCDYINKIYLYVTIIE